MSTTEDKRLHDLEMLIDDLEMRHSNRVSELEGRIQRLEQDVMMIEFNRRHNR